MKPIPNRERTALTGRSYFFGRSIIVGIYPVYDIKETTEIGKKQSGCSTDYEAIEKDTVTGKGEKEEGGDNESSLGDHFGLA